MGSHKGGFTPFEFDITEAMGCFVDSDASSPSRSIELVVQVLDATGNFQARGKQSKKPHGIWVLSRYTPKVYPSRGHAKRKGLSSSHHFSGASC